VASKVASSTRVDMAESIAFHSSEPLVFAENTKAKCGVNVVPVKRYHYKISINSKLWHLP
jgi:hypothetical protein